MHVTVPVLLSRPMANPWRFRRRNRSPAANLNLHGRDVPEICIRRPCNPLYVTAASLKLLPLFILLLQRFINSKLIAKRPLGSPVPPPTYPAPLVRAAAMPHPAFAAPAVQAGIAPPRHARAARCHTVAPPTRVAVARRQARMSGESSASAAGPVPPATTAAPATLAARKQALYDAVAGLDLGRAVLDDAAAQARVDEVIKGIEAENPTVNPADDPLRQARWRLVYTTSPIVLGRNRPGFAAPETCWQVLEMEDGADEGQVLNEEEGVFRVFGAELRWRNRIVGRVKALRGERLRLKFEKFTIGKWFSVPFPGPVVGWQDQTFLDEQLRIARTQYGNVFVLERDVDAE
jgi:PAP_fibrillin